MATPTIPARDSSISDRRQEQRTRLLQAAYELVPEVGVSGLRTRDIAQRAGVNIATLHYCFAGKDALLQALFEFIREKFMAEFGGRVAQARTPPERLIAHTEMRVGVVREQPQSLQVWRAFLGEAWVNPTIRAIVQRQLADQRERAVALLVEGATSGEFALPPGIDPVRQPQIAASMLIALYEGILFQYSMDPDAFDLDEYAQAVYALFGVKA